MTAQPNQIARRDTTIPGYFYTVEFSKLFSTDERFEELEDLYSLVAHYSDGAIRILGSFTKKDEAIFFLDHLAF